LERTNGELRQFAYAASHDLREPLRTISVYSELLKSENAVHLTYRNDKAAEYLQFISASARRMSQLVDSLLEYSCVADAAGESPVPVPFHQTLQTTLANLSGSIADNEAVITYDRLPNIMGKEIHFAQLLQNLIGNALKYRGPESPRIHVAAKEDENAWVFSVSDNGQGIAPAYREQIFELFARLHGHEYPGAGIGLATCKKVVERYGGRIWVESEVGRGSTFFFTLPAATEFQKPS
jgi:light-regulated signal transduction histidine kinase (bacteriophytochrome)